MNQEKIGKFIKKLREENNLTQEELGEKFRITGKSVSKWERGVTMPDISNLQLLSEMFNVSVNEILSGEKNPTKEKSNKNIINFLKQYTKSNKKKYLRYIMVIILVFCSLLGILYIYNDYDKNAVYKLSTTEEGYSIKGYFITNPGMNILMIDEIQYEGPLIGTADEPYIDEASVKFMINDKVLFSNLFSKDDKKYYADFLDLLKFTKLDENKKKISINSFNKSENNFKLIIEYEQNKKLKQQEIKLNVEQLFSNDQIFY